MPSVGYGNNGQYYAPSGLVTWASAEPPIEQVEGDDIWLLFALGERELPAISQADDEAWSFKYPGGA